MTADRGDGEGVVPALLQDQQWPQGRAALVGDAAHSTSTSTSTSTSPYSAYGAGMAVEGGYFLGRHLGGLDLTDHHAVRAALQAYENPRKPHTARQTQQAWILGKVFHHAPAPLRPLRDLVLDHTPLLQKVVGENSPPRDRQPDRRHRPRRGAVRRTPAAGPARGAVNHQRAEALHDLGVGHQRQPATHETMTTIAMIMLMSRRLTRSPATWNRVVQICPARGRGTA